MRGNDGNPCCLQGYYMQRKGISLQKSSVALTLLSLSEFVTYVLASVLGDNLKGRLIYANVVSSSCLAAICVAWPFVDVNYALILAISLGELLLVKVVISIFLLHGKPSSRTAQT